MRHLRKITSRDNEHIKHARRVRDGKEAGKIFLEGLRLVEEAARSRVVTESVFVTGEILEQFDENDLMGWLRPKNLFEVPEAMLQSLADTSNAQGIVMISERPETGPDRIELRQPNPVPLVIFLHRINNPSNLGAVIRTAEAVGVAGVIVSDGSADAFSAKALRAAMGSSMRLPIWTGAKFETVLEWSRSRGLRTIAADNRAERSYVDVDWQIPRMLIVGSEAHGLDDSDLEQADEKIVIPMAKEVESLNLAVACGVIMFEARRQNALR